MQALTTMALAALPGAGLVGCGDGSSGGGLLPANSMPQIAAADNDPLVPSNSAQVVGSIEALFGTSADDPVNVLAGESVDQMITRLGGQDDRMGSPMSRRSRVTDHLSTDCGGSLRHVERSR